MDSLEALSDHRAHSQQERTLRRPVARRPGPVLLAGDHDQGHALRAISLRSFVDGELIAAGEVPRPVTLPLDELVAQPDVAKRAAHHHLMVAAPRPVAVEVWLLDAMLDEVLAGGTVGRDRAGGRDVVRRDRIAEHREDARAADIGQTLRLRCEALEVRWLLDVCGAGIPLEDRSGGRP